MKNIKRFSIYYKINFIIVSAILFLSLTIGLLTIETTSNLLNEQMEKRGAELASYVAALSRNDILLDDHYSLFDRINKTKNNTKDVRYILISDSAGRIIAHTFPGGLPEGLPLTAGAALPAKNEAADSNGLESGLSPDYEVAKYDSNEGSIREITVPIESGIGFVRVGMSEKGTQLLIRQKTNAAIGITLISCILAMLASTYLAHLIIKPVETLAAAAAEIRKGNFSVQAQETADDEIGHLTVVFNEMVAGLKHKESENKHLLDELREKEEMRTILINKLITIQEEERKRISRELHDETGQYLTSLLAYLKVLMSKLTNDTQKTLLQGARDLVIDVLDGVRKTAVDLRPPALDDLGITAAMTKYIQKFGTEQNVNVKFAAPEARLNLSNETALTLYRILQESLTNVARHARATSVSITLDLQAAAVTLKVEDNGLGAGFKELEIARAKNRLGIYGMQERAELLGGKLEFHSAPDRGTVVFVTLPI
ncbi:MAG: ATP-binding protein [Veillonellales bacterium]